ncbi:CLUMA_CG013956, isoform C [Clunio marinus]|uniref:CLUMA_CG013956, isoform C n=1 Tax=Clunio marinus TaxID=568069 RepID=A0A1J1IQB6_9DIPT|nr:CLUMA_CG013956, isoform C [Clunio marinus]
MNQQVVSAQDNQENADIFTSLKKLHEIYRHLLNLSDCEELSTYKRYVEDLTDLLNHGIECFEDNEWQMKTHYEQRVNDLTTQLNCYQQQSLNEIDEYKKSDLVAQQKQQQDPFNNMNKLIVAGDKTNNKALTSDLRHESDSNDLQTTCLALETKFKNENDLLRDENNKLKDELAVLRAQVTKNDFVVSDLKNELSTLRQQSQRSFDGLINGMNSNQCDDGSGESIILKEKTPTTTKDGTKSTSALEKDLKEVEKDNSDKVALILEIADKHDHIKHLRAKTRKLDGRVEELERKVQFREKIIRELRRSTKCQAQNISPMSLTPPRTPELKASDSCSNSDLESYKSNFLTVPGQQIASGDSCFSLYDLHQESQQHMEKSFSEINFSHCFEKGFDENNKYEIERLHHQMSEMESENGCNRLLITKLEDELLALRRSETRIKNDRDVKADKLKVLRHRVRTISGKVLDVNNDEGLQKLQMHHSDIAVLEEELKPELDLLKNLVKMISTTKENLDKLTNENSTLLSTITNLKNNLDESIQHNQHLEAEINRLNSETSSLIRDKSTNNVNQHPVESGRTLGNKEVLSDLTSSSPESGESSLSNGNSLSDVINEWKRELEAKNCELRDKIVLIHTLEDQLKHKDSEICDVRDRCKSVESDHEKNCQMINQLKSAIQIHNESIQFLKRQNADLRDELEETKGKLEQHHEYYKKSKKENIDLETENNNLHMTITNMRSTIEELKRGNSIQHSNDIEALNVSINLLNEQFYKENIQKDDQMNLLRDANLQLRTQVFDLNQDIVDLLEIVESLKNRRTLEDFKIAQKEQERQIEKEISNRERDINCLKHFRSRCAEIESEYLEKMASQKLKSDSTIKELELEITSLTEQLIQSHQQNTDYDDLMKQTNVMQNSMHDLETQNDMLRRTIESYEQRFSELQVQLEKINFENESLINEIENLKSDVSDKNKRISEITLDHHKLETDYENQKKNCKCSLKSSPEKRSSSTVMQINDLKTKLMNKSMEHTKATEALKRKSAQLEKLQKTAFEEKNRLRDECLKSIQTIGELKSKISMLELRIQDQNEEVASSREKVSQALARMTTMETELTSKTAKLEDLETREEKWRTHAYEITHEIKNRKEDSFKREQKLLDELNVKTNAMKDQTRIILQHENSIHHLRSENDTLKSANASLNQRNLQEESAVRENCYQQQIKKLTIDKRNLHKDRTNLTKQLLGKHRDMIILNSEIEKFRDPSDYETKSSSQHNSITPFQSVMYPSTIAPIFRASSNPNLATDPIAIEAKSITEQMHRTRKFWSHGIKVAASSLVNIPSQYL